MNKYLIISIIIFDIICLLPFVEVFLSTRKGDDEENERK